MSSIQSKATIFIVTFGIPFHVLKGQTSFNAFIIFALLHRLVNGYKLDMSEPLQCLIPGPYCIYRCPRPFLKLAHGIFRGLTENLGKICEGNINASKYKENLQP